MVEDLPRACGRIRGATAEDDRVEWTDALESVRRIVEPGLAKFKDDEAKALLKVPLAFVGLS